ncbi:MAG: hypothetical protein Q8916_06160 [Bacteroidota bacterium]|nr:hypothetical protein [Bacteroidota bacterium]MDP4229973.1 hypothetical protein [Bacteroidota bacterium]MDP4236547.1 hypothetical protein [Bacteroidota bacterium]
MRNVIFIIAIFFWILNMIAKSKRRQKQTTERERIVELNKRVGQRTETDGSRSRKSQQLPREIQALLATRKAPLPEATDYELAYASNDYAVEEKKAELPLTEVELEPASHFRKNIGMIESLGTESAEEKEAYDKDKRVIPSLELTAPAIRQYVIGAEILGKPKALRNSRQIRSL